MGPRIESARFIQTDLAYGLRDHIVGHVDSAFLGALKIKEHVLARSVLRIRDPEIAQVFSYVVLIAGSAFKLPAAVIIPAPLGGM